VSNGPTILIVDDDRSITRSLERALGLEGYRVTSVAAGEPAVEAIQREAFDLLVLDLGLPDIDGIEVCRRVRSDFPSPIIMLTARDETNDRVIGLDSGADDYVIKPFALEELLARIRALLRRHQQRPDSDADVLVYQDLSLDDASREVRRGERRIELSATEFALLRFFLANPRQVFSREVLLDRVWDSGGGESNVADVYIGYLRVKLEAGGEPRLIQTVRGVGYVLRETGDPSSSA
jgi:two-component system response regulator MprA